MKKPSTLLFLFALSLFSITAFGQAQFTADKFSGCSPLSVQFTETGSATSWDWNFGNGNISCCSLKVVTAQYNTAGTYAVTLKINGGSTATHIITVFKRPTAKFTASDDTICENDAVTFKSISDLGDAPIKTYSWGFADGTLGNTSTDSIIHTFTLAGVRSITLVIEDTNTCQSAALQTTTVVVLAKPNANFSFTPIQSCTTPATVTFNNLTSPAAAGYSWTFGDPASGSANTSSLPNPTHTYTSKGQFQVTLTATSGTCSSQTSASFNIPVPGFTTSSDTVCRYSSITFSNTSVPVPSSPKWDFGDPGSGALNTSTVLHPTHFYGTPGSYTVTMIPSNGCNDTVRKVIVVRPKPVMSFTVADSNFCQPPANITFITTSNPLLGSWQWYFADSVNLFFDSIYSPLNNYSFSQYGHYDVRLIGTDIYGCTDTTTKLSYINIVAPTVNITSLADSGCLPKAFTFNSIANVVTGDNIKKYFWNFGDGSSLDSTSGLATITHTYTTCGIFNVSLTINTNKGCSAIATRPGLVRTGQKPTAGFSWAPSITCYGDSIQFTDTSKTNGCPLTAWNWDFGSNQQSPKWVMPDTGNWDVTLRVYSNGCLDSVKKNSIIYIWPPKPIFFYDPILCTSHDTIRFHDISHGDRKLIWNFGDGSPTDTSQNPIHVFPGRGTYWVKLTAINDSVNPPNGCQYTDSLPVTITAPLSIITGSLQGCHPFFTQLSGNTSVDAVSYSWDFGDPLSGINNISTQVIDTHTFVMPGTYAVKLTITDRYGCTDDTTVIYRVQGPTANFQASSISGCRPLADTLLSTSLTEGSAITQYIWNFNYPSPLDVLTTTSPVATHTYTTSGAYTVQLITVDANGCRDTLIKPSYIIVSFPLPQFLNDTFVCDQTAVPLLTSVNGLAPFTYSWSFGDGQPDVVISNSTSSTSLVTHTYLTNNTSFILSVNVKDANGCSNTITQNITVLRPSALFTFTKVESCKYTKPTYLPPTGDSITSWMWNITGSFNYTANSLDTVPDFIFTTPGKYYTTLTVTNPGCSDSYTDTTFIVPGPLAYFDYLVPRQCPPVKVDFTSHLLNNEPYTYIEWDFGDGSTGRVNYPDSVISHTYRTDGIYTPSAQIGYTLSNGNNCAITDTNFSAPIVVISSLLVDITQGSIVLTEGQVDTLYSVLTTSINSTPPYTYIWNVAPDGATLPVINTDQALYTAREHDQYVVLTVRDASGCEAVDTVFIEVKVCEDNLKIPNVFTPNGDFKNETYYIDSLCPNDNFKATIYNRWGNIVYTTTDYQFHWDGKDDNGKECSSGVYYYLIEAKHKNLHGYIQLIRE